MTAFQPHISPTPPEPGRGSRVLLLVSGGIAAYKACYLVRLLVDAGCTVQVAMTEAATRFVGPLTFEALSGRPVGTSLWGEGGEQPLDHIQWVRDADLVLVAPATADFLAKMAVGLANDLPSTLVTAADVPIAVCPAMNDRMWMNPPNQENLARLRERGVHVVEPGTGFLACGTVAEGRLAEPEEIAQRVAELLAPGPLTGNEVLVTGGGTREPIDAARFLGNRSSGRMGIALAAAARDLGARVTLLLGPTELAPPAAVSTLRFDTTEDLRALLTAHAPSAGAIAMSAAVSDYRPARSLSGKHKKESGVPKIELEATPDLLAELGRVKSPGQCLIGFALEAGSDDDVEREAQRKLGAKNLDLVCGNRADQPGEGFEGESNRIYLFGEGGSGAWIGPASKLELSRRIWMRAIEQFAGAGKSRAPEASKASKAPRARKTPGVPKDEAASSS